MFTILKHIQYRYRYLYHLFVKKKFIIKINWRSSKYRYLCDIKIGIWNVLALESCRNGFWHFVYSRVEGIGLVCLLPLESRGIGLRPALDVGLDFRQSQNLLIVGLHQWVFVLEKTITKLILVIKKTARIE
jgi:hypothetical protein